MAIKFFQADKIPWYLTKPTKDTKKRLDSEKELQEMLNELKIALKVMRGDDINSSPAEVIKKNKRWSRAPKEIPRIEKTKISLTNSLWLSDTRIQQAIYKMSIYK